LHYIIHTSNYVDMTENDVCVLYFTCFDFIFSCFDVKYIKYLY